MCGSELHSLRAIKAIIPTPYHPFDSQSGAYMLRADPADISPFIGTDSFTMPQPFFGPHPHAGMSAVTLMLPEAEGGFINRDSLGDRSLIAPGDLHWTQADPVAFHVNRADIPIVPVDGGSVRVVAGEFAGLASPINRDARWLTQVNTAQAAIIFAADGAVAKLQAGNTALRGVFFSGTPITEPMYPKGPFMGNTAHDVAEYAARYQSGEMGSLSKSF